MRKCPGVCWKAAAKPHRSVTSVRSPECSLRCRVKASRLENSRPHSLKEEEKARKNDHLSWFDVRNSSYFCIATRNTETGSSSTTATIIAAAAAAAAATF